MAKSRSQSVNLPGARPLMNPLIIIILKCRYLKRVAEDLQNVHNNRVLLVHVFSKTSSCKNNS